MAIFNVETGSIVEQVQEFRIYPASHYVTSKGRQEETIKAIRTELTERVDELLDLDKYLEAKRLEQRTLFDLEMIQEIGYCSGIENYSRHLSARKPGERPYFRSIFYLFPCFFHRRRIINIVENKNGLFMAIFR